MQEIHSSNPPVLTEIFDPNKLEHDTNSVSNLAQSWSISKKIQTFYTGHLLLTPASNRRPGVYLRSEQN